MAAVAVWTLWLVTFAGGTSSASAVVTPLATYSAQKDCLGALNEVTRQMRAEYAGAAPQLVPSPGLMFCVYGTTLKR